MFAGAEWERHPSGKSANWIDVLSCRAAARPDRKAYQWLRDNECAASLSYGELDGRARAIAGFLQHQGLAGERALLFYESGLDYIAALFGCFYAGVVAVPLYPPRRKPAVAYIESICANARPATVLTTPSLRSVIQPLLADCPHLAPSAWRTTTVIPPGCEWHEPAIDGQTPALLQYTSGSTGDPRGVVLTHQNLLHNQQVMQETFGVAEDSVIVSWLPLYHDMGLIGAALHPVFAGAQCHLMPPSAFLQRPLRWLQAISLHKASVSGGPNFSYDLCVDKIKPADRAGLDLSHWTVAFNGSEPVRAETLERFAEAFGPCGFRIESFRPCYGLAEATLLVAGKSRDGRPTVCRSPGEDGGLLVSCGSGPSSQRIAIVDCDTGQEQPPGSTGEIWVAGPGIATGYWDRPEETLRTFQAELPPARTSFLRTGDLGFLKEGELYITGRLKDLIIVNGRNIYPQDVERVAERSHAGLRPNCGAAFAVDLEGRERLIVVQEFRRSYAAGDLEGAARAIRSAVSDSLEIAVQTVVLLQSGALPKTTSGKVRRNACRTAFLNGSLPELGRWDLAVAASAFSESEPEDAAGASASRAAELLQWLRAYAADRINSHLIDERRCIPPHIVLDFGNHGMFGLQVPERYGGLALRNCDMVRVIEQLAAIDLTLALLVGNHNALGLRPLLQYGTQKLRDELLPALAQGRELAAFALTEPGAGSNPRAIEAKATRDAKGGWRLSGTKLWIGSGSWAGVINVFAHVADASAKPGEMVAFAVRQGTKGVRHGPEALTMGMRGMVQNAIYLNDVSVSGDLLLGEPGEGLQVAQDAMMFGRLGLGATAVGGMKRCAQLMLRYARRRNISTGRLLDNPVTLSRLSELIAATAAVESLVRHAAELLDQQVHVPSEVFIVAKIAGAEYLWRAADDLVQLLGGRGYMESNAAAQILRDARVFRIFEGPTETLQSFLGATVLHGSGELDLFLSRNLNAPDVLERLGQSTARIHEHYVAGAGTFQDRASMLRWVHYVVGRVACSAILLAFARRGDGQRSSHHGSAAAWAARQFERDVADTLHPQEGSLLLRPEEASELVSAYAGSVGDIEQTLPGEDHALDWLLRPEPPAAEKPARPMLLSQSQRPARKDLAPMENALSAAAPPVATPGAPAGRSRTEVEKWLHAWLIREARIPPALITVHKPFADFGLDSTTAIMLVADLEDFLGARFETTLAWDFPTISALAEFLAKQSADANQLRQTKEREDVS